MGSRWRQVEVAVRAETNALGSLCSNSPTHLQQRGDLLQQQLCGASAQALPHGPAARQAAQQAQLVHRRGSTTTLQHLRIRRLAVCR